MVQEAADFSAFRRSLRLALRSIDKPESCYHYVAGLCISLFQDAIDDDGAAKARDGYQQAGPGTIADLPQLHLDDAVAVGVHGAGGIIAAGRHVAISVSRGSLVSSLREHLQQFLAESAAKSLGFGPEDANVVLRRVIERLANGSTQESLLFLGRFLRLFDRLYYDFTGREHTLIHRLLASDANTLNVLYMPTGSSVDKGHVPAKLPRGANCSTITFNAATQWPHLENQPLLRRFVACVAEAIESEVTLDDPPIAARQLTRRFRSESSQDSIHFCMAHTLDSIRRVDPQVFHDSWVDKGDAHSDHERDDDVLRWMLMVQRFLLFRAFCGDHFYVLYPRASEALQFCVTLGTTRPLLADALDRWASFTDIIGQELSRRMNELQNADPPAENFVYKESEPLRALIGRSWDAFCRRIRAAISNNAVPEETVQAWLFGLLRYLNFAILLSDIAVHEGKRQRLNFLVGDGVFASKALEIQSQLPRSFGQGLQVQQGRLSVPARIDHHADDQKTAQALASLLLGNISFFQAPNAALYGSRAGEIAGLARVYNTEHDHKALAGDLDQVASATTADRDAFLVRLREDGDVQLIANGELLLWRRGGQFLVPHSYGPTYREQLVEGLLSGVFGGTHSARDSL